MTPDQLQARNFDAWPPLARELATARLALLQRLPLAFISLLFRELIDYDWKFPLERNELDRQFTYLAALAPDEMNGILRPFADLRLSRELVQIDWVNAPARFSEQLSASLWATGQMDSFRRSAIDYVERFNAAVPEPPPALARLCIVLVGLGVKDNSEPLFRKVRRHGVLYTQLQAADARKAALNVIAQRARSHPVPYAHWYIDGSSSGDGSLAGLTSISWETLTPVRAALRRRIRAGFESHTGPEELRTMLARTRPEDIGLARGDAVLDRFQLSLFTEGSGTQIFSTTFVQWAAREALRRAHPLTMLLRFAPRACDYSMQELLSMNEQSLALDPEGALRDADMGAWYTLLNLKRLPGAENASFVVCFEGHSQAVAVGPQFKAGGESRAAISFADLLEQGVNAQL